MFRDLGPNWFASVMGTGIVANAAAVLPLQVPGLRGFATAVWGWPRRCWWADRGLGVHWTRYPERARAHASNPVMAQFWGAPAMALMTVGAGTLVLGRGVIGPAAVGIDWVLWLAGTALGLVTAVWIPYLMMTRHDIGSGDAFGGWLMPVVPPMVSAATGALLIPHVGSAQALLTLLLACYAMFGISLFASVIIISPGVVAAGHAQAGCRGHGAHAVDRARPARPVGDRGREPGTAAAHVLPAPYAAGAAVFALLYGVPTWGFAMMWLALAAAITLRTGAAGPAVRADLVELHVPGRDVRHRDDLAGGPHSRGRATGRLGPPVRLAARSLAGRRGAHRLRRGFRPTVQARVAAISRALST